MGNEWDIRSEDIKIIKPCPCGKDAYVEVTREYVDNYLHHHTTYDNQINCCECARKYEYYHDQWVTKNDFTTIKKMEEVLNQAKKEAYNQLYQQHYSNIKIRLGSKKALHDLLYKNRLFNVPTLQTFYKNGVDHYIREDYSCCFDSMVKMVDLSVGLSLANKQMIDNINEKQEAINAFIKDHSIK